MVECSLSDGLDMLDPIGYTQLLFCDTKSDWTAVFVADGELPTSTLANELNCRGLEATLIEDTYSPKDNSGEHGCVRLRMIRDANRTRFIDDEERLLYVTKSDGGKRIFHSSGTIQPFENIDSYNNPKISDRFTPELLDGYMKELGIDMTDENFYGPHMAFAEYKNKFPESGYERQTYLAYHLERKLQYGRQ